MKTDQNRGSDVYVALHNANRRSWDKMELSWFLEERKRAGKQLLAFCMTEPNKGMWTDRFGKAEDYDITEENVASEHTQNRHLETGIFYQKHSELVTAREIILKEKHLGLTWIAIETGQERVKPIAICTVYFPTARSKSGVEYKESLLRTLQKQLLEVRSQGYAAVIMGDFNCPFMERGVMAASGLNGAYWRKLLSITRMAVVNWENSSRASTRGRGEMRGPSWIWYWPTKRHSVG